MRMAFTVEEANRTLPLVRRIVQDIVQHYTEWQGLVARCDAFLLDSSESGHAQVEALQRETQRIAAEIDAFIRELEAIGVHFKGFDTGLVDFPGEIEGREVYLCWHLGEPEVAYWHEIDEGFGGRHLLSSQPSF